MQDLIEFLARSLVDNADDVKTRMFDRDRDDSTIIELEVAPSDLGKVIGRQGRTARAIRTLLAAASQKSRRRYVLDILD
jgi:predicted RNA-binding protein YlqC (UPF0109 family)